MGRKFESELAGQIAQRNRNLTGRRTMLLLAALVSSAVMIGATAAVMSLNATAAIGGPTEYVEALSGEDYIVYSADETPVPVYSEVAPLDDDFLVKRASVLKHVEFDTPGQSPNIYTKFVYSVNVKLRDIGAFETGVAGMKLSTLKVDGLGELEPIVVSTTIAVDGVQVMLQDGATPLSADAYISWEFVDGTLSLDVDLPDLAGTNTAGYENGDMVSVFLMWKVPVSGWLGMVEEVGFPDYQLPSE